MFFSPENNEFRHFRLKKWLHTAKRKKFRGFVGFLRNWRRGYMTNNWIMYKRSCSTTLDEKKCQNMFGGWEMFDAQKVQHFWRITLIQRHYDYTFLKRWELDVKPVRVFLSLLNSLLYPKRRTDLSWTLENVSSVVQYALDFHTSAVPPFNVSD